MIIGPFSPGFVADVSLTQQLAEIGVILLMFGVGIHFSFRDLNSVRNIAVPGAVVQSTVATVLGMAVGIWQGWGWGAGLVLGLAISVASTIVLLRALEERNELDSTHGRIAVGWLIVEDLFTVLVLVLLPGLAGALGSQTASGLAAAVAGENLALALLVTVGKVVFLTVLMIVVGTRIVPYLLVQVARNGSRELFTLGVLAVALGIAYFSSLVFGVSLALGAFLAGAVVSESDLSHQAATDALPLRDAFAVLFFVSVGMLFDPSILIASPILALAVLAIILIGKPVAAMGIVLLFGYPLRSALTVAAGLAQVGEFSFILADLGLVLGVLPQDAYTLIITGALLSITLNPFVFRTVEPIEQWLRSRPRVMRFFEWRAGELAKPLNTNGGISSLRGHAVICGYGRVGSLVGEALERRNLPFVVIEQERRRVERLRERGITALYGDASNPLLLARVGLERARILVVTVPDPPATRQIVQYARRVNPRLDIVVRAQSTAEREFLYRQGTREVVVGVMEVGLEIARHSLHRFGLNSTETQAILQSLRLEHGEGVDMHPEGTLIE